MVVRTFLKSLVLGIEVYLVSGVFKEFIHVVLFSQGPLSEIEWFKVDFPFVRLPFILFDSLLTKQVVVYVRSGIN